MSLSETLRRLPPAAADFARSVFDHHWREASWLYERRAMLHTQGALLSTEGWLDVEARADAHVRALARGDHLVVDDCEHRAVEGDVGELHTAVRILCRTDQPDQFNALVDRLDWVEPARASAVADALAWDAADTWEALVEALLADESLPDDAVGPLARVVGLRGWPLGEALLGVLEDRVGDLAAVAWATGALGYREAQPELYTLIEEPLDPAVRQAAAIAALRFAPGQVLAFLQQVVDAEDWAAVPLALAGGPSVCSDLLRVAGDTPSPERLLALGLFGHVDGIELLMRHVEDETCGEAATQALYLLTGAPLHEEGIEHDPEAEPVADGNGEAQPGLLVRRLPRSREIWAAWIDEHRHAFSAHSARLRYAEPLEPRAELRRIGHAAIPLHVRTWMLEELDIRYRLRCPAWPRLAWRSVQRGLHEGDALAQARPKIIAGEWYLGGQPLRSP
ncbi:MAG: hypothetical protein K0V04_39130 [Deltaproteobacteria bacterium]|nr:hypothetical protein [Deltaproteobacteria bacterium]